MMWPLLRLAALITLTLAVALGPVTVSTIYVHTHHHQTTGSRAGGIGDQP